MHVLLAFPFVILFTLICSRIWFGDTIWLYMAFKTLINVELFIQASRCTKPRQSDPHITRLWDSWNQEHAPILLQAPPLIWLKTEVLYRYCFEDICRAGHSCARLAQANLVVNLCHTLHTWSGLRCTLCPFRQLANMKFSLCVPLGNWLTWMLHHTTDLDFPNHGPSCSLLLKHQLVKPVTCLEGKSSGFTAEDGWMLSLQKKCIHDPWIWKRKGCGRRCLLCRGIIKLLSFHHNRRQQNGVWDIIHRVDFAL